MARTSTDPWLTNAFGDDDERLRRALSSYAPAEEPEIEPIPVSSMSKGALAALAGKLDEDDEALPEPSRIFADKDPTPTQDASELVTNREPDGPPSQLTEPERSMPVTSPGPERSARPVEPQRSTALVDDNDGWATDAIGRAADRRSIDAEKGGLGKIAGALGLGGGDEPGVSPWAILADVIANKGRGIGQIVAMSQQQKEAYAKRMDAKQARDQETAFRERSYQDAAKEREANKALSAEQRAAAKEEKETRDWERYHPKDVPESRDDERTRLNAEAIAADRDIDNKRANETLAFQKSEAEARTQREIADDEQRAQQNKAQLGYQYAQLGETRRAHDLTAADQERDRAARAAEALAKSTKEKAASDAQFATIPNTEVIDEPAWRSVASNAANKKGVEEKVGKLGVLQTNVAKMRQLQDQYGSQSALMGDPEVAAEYETARSGAMGAYTELAATGVLNNTERVNLGKLFPEGKYAAGDLARDAASKFIPGVRGSDEVKSGMLEGAGRTIDESIQRNLSSAGIRITGSSGPAAKSDDEIRGAWGVSPKSGSMPNGSAPRSAAEAEAGTPDAGGSKPGLNPGPKPGPDYVLVVAPNSTARWLKKDDPKVKKAASMGDDGWEVSFE